MPAATMIPHAEPNSESRHALVLEHFRLVHHVAGQVMRSTSVDIEFDELVGAGAIGLMNAIDNFDPSRGLAFSTFAAPRIRGSILDDLRRLDEAPRSVRRKQRELARARAKLAAVHGHEPSDADLAAELGVPLSKVWAWKRDTEHAGRVSLERKVDPASPSGPAIEEIVASDDDEGIEDIITRREEIAILRDAIMELKEQERLVLSLYYFEELKLREIADMLGVTESRVCQIRSKAIGGLRERMGHLREA